TVSIPSIDTVPTIIDGHMNGKDKIRISYDQPIKDKGIYNIKGMDSVQDVKVVDGSNRTQWDVTLPKEIPDTQKQVIIQYQGQTNDDGQVVSPAKEYTMDVNNGDDDGTHTVDFIESDGLQKLVA